MGATTVVTFQEGISGEFVDYFAAKCTGVISSISYEGANTVTTATTYVGSGSALYSYEMNSGYYPGSLTAYESALLKKCLGDSDGNDSYGNNVEVYDWDYGSYKIGGQEPNGGGSDGTYTYNLETVSSHPHAIKLVSATASDDYVGGLYYLTWYQSTLDRFILVNAPVKDTSSTASYYVYTTDGVVERVIVTLPARARSPRATLSPASRRSPPGSRSTRTSCTPRTTSRARLPTRPSSRASTRATCSSLSTPRTSSRLRTCRTLATPLRTLLVRPTRATFTRLARSTRRIRRPRRPLPHCSRQEHSVRGHHDLHLDYDRKRHCRLVRHGSGRRQRWHCRPLQVHSSYDRQLRVRLAVLGPWLVCGRHLRVLQGLHQGRLRYPVGVRCVRRLEKIASYLSLYFFCSTWVNSMCHHSRLQTCVFMS